MKKELSVIIPAFNEQDRIGQTLEEAARYLDGKNYLYEVIVVDDGSSDATAKKVELFAKQHPQVRLVRMPQNRGKGEAVKEGVGLARYAYCLMMDADHSTRIDEWDKFEDLFDRDFPVVIASRHLPASVIAHPQPWLRRFLGAGYRRLCGLLFGVRASDINCGFKAYRTDIAKKIYSQNRMSDWTYDIEVLRCLKEQQIRFAEVPVTWSHCQKSSHLSPVRTAAKTLRSLWKLSQSR